MKRLAALILVVGMSAFGITAGATAKTYPLGHARSCRVDYHKATSRHIVRKRVKIHGRWRIERRSVRYIACDLNPVSTTTTTQAPSTTTSTSVTIPTLVPAVRATIDPSFTQSSLNPLVVTWTYSASVTDGTLPTGTLSFYWGTHGSVASTLGCSINVGGPIYGGLCTVTLPSFGQYDLTTVYAGGVQGSTATETDTISPFSAVVAVGSPVTSETVVNNDWALRISLPVTVSGVGSPTGTVTMTGGTCSALVNGAATCSITEPQGTTTSSFTPVVSYSGDTDYSPASVTGAAVTIPVAPPPQTSNVTTSVAFSYMDCGGTFPCPLGGADPGYSDLIATVTPSSASVGSVAFTWTGQGIPESCTATTGNGGVFYCGPVSNPTLFPFPNTVSVSYSGGTVTSGDAYATHYSSATTTGTVG